MHRFLQSIGFHNINSRQDTKKLLDAIAICPDSKKQLPGSNYIELKKEIARHTGFILCGEQDSSGNFQLEHYFPYFQSPYESLKDEITINRRVDTNAFSGMCDDIHMGISMIFYLQNAADYLALSLEDNKPVQAKTALSGLALKGTILLGVESSADSIIRKNIETHMRNELIAMAKTGDQEAIDNLTIDEIDLSAKINRRIKTEDLYSIVETTCVPYGSESDNYLIIGTIVSWSKIKNKVTGEDLYHLLLSCNDISLNICISKNDLTGTPSIGCRFKGVIWMQGYVDFHNVLSDDF